MLYAQEGSKILGQKMFQNGVLTLGNIYPNPSKVFSDPINDKLWQKIKTSRNLDFLGQTAVIVPGKKYFAGNYGFTLLFSWPIEFIFKI